MSAFIETSIFDQPALLNVDAIEMVKPRRYRGEEKTSICCLRPCERQGAIDFDDLPYHIDMNEYLADEPYETLKAKILKAVENSKEKENIPPTPPIREKENERYNTTSPARARKEFTKPTVEEVKAHVAEKGYTFDPEEFWNFYESKGWRVGSNVMKSWHAACVTWQKSANRRAKAQAHIDARMDEREEKRQAHFDAKMDERERKRERLGVGGRKKADNWVPMSDEVREGVRRDFNF